MGIRAWDSSQQKFFYANSEVFDVILSRCSNVGRIFHEEKSGIMKYNILYTIRGLRDAVRDLDMMRMNGYYEPVVRDSIEGLRDLVLYSMRKRKDIRVEVD